MRILIVEDDFVSRRLLTSYLASMGAIDSAANGEEALVAVRESLESGRRYDLICLDIMMPGLDGQKTLKEIRRLEEERGIRRSDGSKIVMTTALSDIQNMWQAFNEQCDAYLVKPIKREVLMEQLRTLDLIPRSGS